MLLTKLKTKRQGFTLIELLLYISLMALLVLAASSFITMTFKAKAKNKIIAEVEQQGEMISYLISHSIRNASLINSPATSTSATLLSLSSTDLSKNPTIFTLVNGNIVVSYAGGTSIPLNNNYVTVTNLNFLNLSLPGTNGNINIQFTLGAIDPYGRSEYTYSKTFNTSASRRY